jgi:ABC-type hemin transport system ATPase subunit
VIRIKHITLARGPRALLRDADAAISPGERIALIGDNGSGKSTLLGAIAGEVSLDAGEIELPSMRISPSAAVISRPMLANHCWAASSSSMSPDSSTTMVPRWLGAIWARMIREATS